MAAGLPDCFRHNIWANLRLLDACAQLSDAQLDATAQGLYGSVRQTLMHMLSSEEGYAQAVTGSATTPLLKDISQFPGFDELRRRAELSGDALVTLAERAEQADVDRILH